MADWRKDLVNFVTQNFAKYALPKLPENVRDDVGTITNVVDFVTRNEPIMQRPLKLTENQKHTIGFTDFISGKLLEGTPFGTTVAKATGVDIAPLKYKPQNIVESGLGFVAEQAPSMIIGSQLGKAFKPAIKPVTGLIGREASKQIASGNLVRGLALKGLGSGLPFNLGWQAVKRIDPTTKEQAGNLVVDTAIDATLGVVLPMGMTKILHGKGDDMLKAIDNPETKAQAVKKLKDLMNYTDDLIKTKGYSRKEAEEVGYKEAMKILYGSDLQNKFDKLGADIRKKVNFFDYLATPDYVLKKIGFGKYADNLRGAMERYDVLLKGEITRVDVWFKRAGTRPAVSQRIFKWLDGTANDNILYPDELQVAKEIKGYLSKWADKLQLPQDKRIGKYITHLFNFDFAKKEFDPEIARLIDESIPGSVYNPFKGKRTGVAGFKEDVWQALDAYVKRATRDYVMSPAIKPLKEIAQKLDPESSKYIERLLKQVNMQPIEVENLLDNWIKQSPIGYKFGQRPSTVLSRKWRQTVSRGAIGLNLKSVIRNLGQVKNTVAEEGITPTLAGYYKLFRSSITGNLDELYENGVLKDSYIQDRVRSVGRKFLQNFDDGLFKAFEVSEIINRGGAYYTAKAKALAKGMTEEQAIKYAKELVRKTQFGYGYLDTPLILQSDLAKTVFQYQSYSVKQLEFIKNLFTSKNWAGLMRYISMTLAINYGFAKLFGWRGEDIIPTISESPFVSTIQGLWDTTSLDERTRKGGVNKLKQVPWLFMPGGSQIKRMIGSNTQMPSFSSGTARSAGATSSKPFTINLQGLPQLPQFSRSSYGKRVSIAKPKTPKMKKMAIAKNIKPKYKDLFSQIVG